jgi:hypothetical protein
MLSRRLAKPVGAVDDAFADPSSDAGPAAPTPAAPTPAVASLIVLAAAARAHGLQRPACPTRSTKS